MCATVRLVRQWTLDTHSPLPAKLDSATQEP
jgi:hypothetical protein